MIANLRELLSKGYFPSELPPSFTTGGFADFAIRGLRQLPADFETPSPAKLSKYSLARGISRFRRILGLPNPINQFALCKAIATEWKTINGILALSAIAKSTPTRLPQAARAVSPKYKRADVHRFQASARAGCSAVVRTDIAQFYPSLYTHAIAWAFETKRKAKTNKSVALLGNKLDKLVRESQDKQTIGIPIGPDTSFIIAEVVLARCDAALQAKHSALAGVRWLDEFELAAAERGSAEQLLADIQQVISEFELQVNPRKTVLSDLPIEFEPAWIGELRAFQFRGSAVGQANDLTRYFDYVTQYLRSHPDEHVVKYALARIRKLEPHTSNRSMLQSLVCQAASFEPGAIREVLNILFYSETTYGVVLDRAMLELTVNRIIERGAPVGHHYEVSWCLWAAIHWGLHLTAISASGISRMSNSVVAILALDADQQGLFTGQLDTTSWEARMTTEELHDEEWLLAYEANVQAWLPSVGGQDHVAADPAFGMLKGAGVTFYQQSASPFTPGALAYP